MAEVNGTGVESEPELPDHKPPFLKRVRIRGYKSIAFCDVVLEPLTILVGRNASGKSNFLDALGFISDLMENRATKVVEMHRGWNAVLNRSMSSMTIDVMLDIGFISLGQLWSCEYSFSLSNTDGRIKIQHEKLELHSISDKYCYIAYTVNEGKVTWSGDVNNGQPNLFWPLEFPKPYLIGKRHYDRLLLSLLGGPPFLDLSECLINSGVYNFSPSVIREHQFKGGSRKLTYDSDNLASIISSLTEIDDEIHARITQYLRVIVPGLKSFKAVEYGDYETVQFEMDHGSGRGNLTFDASSMSDGTLRVLATLVACHQKILPLGDPGFIAIEEPETSLHPAAMHALVDALDEATLGTQIILTTHSADMLDCQTITPKNVRVVRMIDGSTWIGPIDAASKEIVDRKLCTLGDLERQNRLTIDEDDLQRQRAELATLEAKAEAVPA